MSEVGIERVRNYESRRVQAPTRAICQCCPYGYHIDLGFVEFCDRLVTENSQPNPEKRERKERRRQRQSMEVLLGLTNPVFWNIQQFLPTVPPHTEALPEEPPLPPLRISSLINDSDALKKAVQDFEATLERTAKKTSSKVNYPNPQEDTRRYVEFDSIPLKDEAQSSLIFRDDGTSSASATPATPLKNIREQMAISLERMRELESKVKTLPSLEKQVMTLEAEKTKLLNRITDLTKQLDTEKGKLKNLSEEISKPTAKAVRDVGILCMSITRDVGVSPILPKVKTQGTVTDRPLTADKTCETDDVDTDGRSNRISLKDLDKVQDLTWKSSKGVQTNLIAAPVLKVSEKGDIAVQTDKVPMKDSGIVAKPIMLDATVEAKPSKRDKGVSDDKITDILCDKCKSVRTRNVGVGVGNVKEVSMVGLGLANRSKSFDLSAKKNTRSIGVSTIPPIKKLTATKQVGTVEVSVPKIHTGVNTERKNFRDAAVIVDFVLKEPCATCAAHANEKKVAVPDDKELPVKEKDDRREAGCNKKSKIPLLKPTTPVADRKKLLRQDTYTKNLPVSGLSSNTDIINRLTSSSELPQTTEEEKVQVTLRKKTPKATDPVAETAKRLSLELHLGGNRDSACIGDRLSGIFDDCGFEYDEHYGEQESNRNSQMFPENAMFQPIQDKSREKLVPSKEMKAAMKVVNDGLHKYPNGLPKHLKTASSIIQQEWFKISSTASANPLDVEDYLDSFEEVSNTLLEFVVNMVDNNGNTAMHYAVSHGNFDVVSILLDSKVCNINKANAAGYTCVMLVSLAQVRSETHRDVVRRLFFLADVNVRAKQHGQTALMLAVSHGRLDMVQLLLDAGADPNIQDCDGSTALMCAAEHGHLEIVKHILAHPDTDPSIVDCDGSSALAIAMEANNRDIGVLLYAREHFAPNSRGSSPYTSLKHRRNRHSSSPHPKTPTSPGPMKRSEHSF